MTLVLAQDGYGPGRKLDAGLEAQVLDGCVLSPHYRQPLRNDWKELIQTFKDAGLALFDPETQLLGIPKDRMGRLREWPYWKQMLDEDALTNPLAYAQSTQALLTQQRDMGFSTVVASGPLISGWRDYEAALLDAAIDAAAQWKKSHGAETFVYVGVAITSGTLRQMSFSAPAQPEVDAGLASWLDRITRPSRTTKRRLDGFYLMVDWDDPRYELPRDERVLANLMYVIYTLSVSNDMPVTLGYTGLWSVLAMAAGAHAVATGWHVGLRRLATEKYRRHYPDGSHPQAPSRRMWLQEPLCELTQTELNSLDVKRMPPPPSDVSDTVAAAMSGRIDAISHLSDPTAEVLHNWHELRALAQERKLGVGPIRDRLAALSDYIDEAQRFAEDNLLPYGAPRGRFMHLQKWREALDLFRAIAPDLNTVDNGTGSGTEST